MKHNTQNESRARQLRKDMTPWERKLWYCFLKDYPVRFQRQNCIDNFIADLNDKIAECYLEMYRKRRSAKRRRIVLAVLIGLLLLLNGITAVEKREEADRRFLRERIGIELPGSSETLPTEEAGEP